MQEQPENYTVYNSSTRTTSGLESYNRVLNSKIKSNGDFWTFVTIIQEEDNCKVQSITAVGNGNMNVYRPKSKNQIKKETDLEKLWSHLKDNKITFDVFLKMAVKLKKESLKTVTSTSDEVNGNGTPATNEKADAVIADELVQDVYSEDVDEEVDEVEVVDNTQTINCQICMIAQANAINMPCRHMYACKLCAEEQQQQKKGSGLFTCSACRSEVEHLVFGIV